MIQIWTHSWTQKKKYDKSPKTRINYSHVSMTKLNTYRYNIVSSRMISHHVAIKNATRFIWRPIISQGLLFNTQTMNNARAMAHIRILRCMNYKIHNTYHHNYARFLTIMSFLTITILMTRTLRDSCFQNNIGNNQGCKKRRDTYHHQHKLEMGLKA